MLWTMKRPPLEVMGDQIDWYQVWEGFFTTKISRSSTCVIKYGIIKSTWFWQDDSLFDLCHPGFPFIHKEHLELILEHFCISQILCASEEINKSFPPHFSHSLCQVLSFTAVSSPEEPGTRSFELQTPLTLNQPDEYAVSQEVARHAYYHLWHSKSSPLFLSHCPQSCCQGQILTLCDMAVGQNYAAPPSSCQYPNSQMSFRSLREVPMHGLSL